MTITLISPTGKTVKIEKLEDADDYFAEGWKIKPETVKIPWTDFRKALSGQIKCPFCDKTIYRKNWKKHRKRCMNRDW